MGWLVFGLFSMMNLPMLTSFPFETSIKNLHKGTVTFKKRAERMYQMRMSVRTGWKFLFGVSEVIVVCLHHYTFVEQRVMWTLSCPLVFQFLIDFTMLIRSQWLNALENIQIRTAQVHLTFFRDRFKTIPLDPRFDF
jgi:hypothetical protein